MTTRAQRVGALREMKDMAQMLIHEPESPVVTQLAEMVGVLCGIVREEIEALPDPSQRVETPRKEP